MEPESRSLAEVNALDSVMLGGTVSLWLEGRICLGEEDRFAQVWLPLAGFLLLFITYVLTNK